MENNKLVMSNNLGEEIIIRIRELITKLDEILRIKNEKKFKDSFLDRN